MHSPSLDLLPNFSEILWSYTLTTRIAGELGYLKLGHWWLTEFTAIERAYIESIYQPMGVSTEQPRPLTQGEVTYKGLTATLLLTCLATWFKKSNERHLTQRILAKAEQELSHEPDILNVHFFWSVKQKFYSTWQAEEPQARAEAIRAAQQQVAIAPAVAQAMKIHYSNSIFPHHEGYHLLITLSIEQGNDAEATRLCQEAKSQGWAGNWEELTKQSQKLITGDSA